MVGDWGAAFIFSLTHFLCNFFYIVLSCCFLSLQMLHSSIAENPLQCSFDATPERLRTSPFATLCADNFIENDGATCSTSPDMMPIHIIDYCPCECVCVSMSLVVFLDTLSLERFVGDRWLFPRSTSIWFIVFTQQLQPIMGYKHWERTPSRPSY